MTTGSMYETKSHVNEVSLQSTWSSSRSLVAAWAVAVIVIWIVALFVARFTTPVFRGAVITQTPVEVLSTWDGRQYAHLAADGYSADGLERRLLAFFPLLPATSRLLGGRDHAPLAGILLSQACLLGSVILLGKLAYGERTMPLRLQPGFWLLVNPLGYIFLVLHTESLCLFLTLVAVYASRRNKFAEGSAMGFLAALTRPTVICLPVLFLWDAIGKFLRRERWLGMLMCAAAPLIGVALYMGVVGYLVGDPLAYFDIQAGWTFGWAFPFVPLVKDFHRISLGLLDGVLPPVDQVVRLFSSVSILVLTIWGWRKCDPAFLVYLIVSIIFIHSQAQVRSTARYELMLFPVYLLLPQMVISRQRVAWIVAGLMIIAQVLLFIRHATWRWVS